jgi:hypothetical protein
MYHFADLEHEIDAALAILFELKDNTAQAITGSVDFLKRFNLVRTAMLSQISDRRGRQCVAGIVKKVKKHNENRNVVAHSRFEPLGDGVQFTRVVAREGAVNIPVETWSAQKFKDEYVAMQELTTQLKEEIVRKAKPVKGYMFADEAGDYLTGQVTEALPPSLF